MSKGTAETIYYEERKKRPSMVNKEQAKEGITAVTSDGK